MRLRIESAVAAANVSAQSPPCNQNAFPSAANAMRALRSSHSPAKTRGGKDLSSCTADLIAAPSFPPGHCGCWAATNPGVKRLSSEEFIGIRVENLGVFAQANYPKKISASL